MGVWRLHTLIEWLLALWAPQNNVFVHSVCVHCAVSVQIEPELVERITDKVEMADSAVA